MRINNFGEFNTFLLRNNLQDISPEVADFSACVSQFTLFCVCRPNEKNKKLQHCDTAYTNLIRNFLTPEFISLLLRGSNNEPIEFYRSDFEFLRTISSS